MSINYDRNYRVLGVEPGCSWEELRSAYRRMVRAWHPDHRPAPGESDQPSNDTIKEITHAFRSLSDYRRRHGYLPAPAADHERAAHDNPPDAGSPNIAAAGPDPLSPSPAHSDPWTGVPRTVRRSPSSTVTGYTIAGAIVVMGYVVLGGLWSDEWSPDNVAQAPPSNADERANTSARGMHTRLKAAYFGIGSGISDVYAIQGDPTHVTSDTWSYGASKIYFANDRVTAWESHPSFPLKADAYPSPHMPATTTFTIGSTKKTVRAVQGLPLTEGDSIWDYGVVRVHFRHDKVIAWEIPYRRVSPLER